MKIAISSQGDTLKAKLDQRFGRAEGFIIYDTDTKEIRYIDNNQNLNLSQGAGIQTAQKIANENVEVIITGYCGPKAFNVLNLAEIKIYNSQENTVEESINKYFKNELKLQLDCE